MFRCAAQRRVAHVAAAAACLLVLGGSALAVINRDAPTIAVMSPARVTGQLVLAVVFTAAGWLLAAYRPAISYGWLALAAGIGHALAVAGPGWAVFTLTTGYDLPGTGAGVVAALVGEPLENIAIVVFLTTFPSGRLPTGWMRHAAAVAIMLCAAAWALGVVMQMAPVDGYPRLTNPLGVLPDALPVELLIAAGTLLGSVVIVVRWRRSVGYERKVLRWLGVVNLVAIALTPVIVLTPVGETIVVVAVTVELAVVVTVVLAHQLYGLEIVLNRTLVYLVLLAMIAAGYAGCVAVVTALGRRNDAGWAMGAAFLAALVLAPARARVQRVVNTFLYGHRDEPYTVISRIASRLESSASVDVLLPSLLDAVISELRLPWAQVELHLDGGGTRCIHRGVCPASDRVRWEFTHTPDGDGAFVVGLRHGQSSLRADEARLLGDIAKQVEVAASNVMLRELLLRSRERVVAASEDERRRLRRDLHDGLGPTLTAAATKLDAAGNLLHHDLDVASRVLEDVRTDLSVALADLRRLVYALHPPVLDQLGLLGSLRQQLPRMGLPVTLRAPPALPVLPDAVAVAAYRIVGEAVTNAARHAGAGRCIVMVTCGDELCIEVLDDGGGREPWIAGLGLTSMRERVDALGGWCQAGPAPGGGRVVVGFPLPRPNALLTSTSERPHGA